MSASIAVYEQRINAVIDYVERHYAEPLPLEALADVAQFSPFHFHRIFRSLVGEPPHAFIRRIRLEKAVGRMQRRTSETLTQIALECGFASSSDFSRAFKQAYGFSPREYTAERFLQESKIRQDLLAHAGYGFRQGIDLSNPDQFRVRLEDHAARPIAYVRVIGGYQPEKIMGGLTRLLDWGRGRALWPGSTLIGMSQDDPDTTPMSKVRYDWCLALPPDFRRDAKVSFGEIPANRFGVLHCQGDIHKVDRAWTYLFRGWLPASGYQPTNDPALEVFDIRSDEIDWTTFDIDCCVPVRPL